MSGLVPMEEAAKDRLDSYLRPLLEAWSGQAPLQRTALYGVRCYVNGSWLARCSPGIRAWPHCTALFP